jgi:transposase InsO family protein
VSCPRSASTSISHRPIGVIRWRQSLLEYATLEWVDWFNNRRILEPIGNITPAEAEQRYDVAMDQLPMAA